MKRIQGRAIRVWLIGGLMAIATAIGVIGWQNPSQAQESTPPAIPAEVTLESAGLTLETLADGVYGLIASTDFPPADFAGTAICNGGIIIGSDSVLVVDPFQNEALANLMLSTVTSLTDNPVTYVVNTHYHFDHTGGNPAAVAEAIPMMGRGPIRELMLTRNLELDPNPTPPAVAVNGDGDIWLGDRQVHFRDVEGHSAGTDLIVYVPDADVLMAGDLFFNERIPYVADGNIRLWREYITTLIADYPTATVLPGHGMVSDNQGLQAQRAYLDWLEATALQWQAEGLSQDEAIAHTSLPEAYSDYLFQSLFPSNLEVAYQQITLGQDDEASINAYEQAQAAEWRAL